MPFRMVTNLKKQCRRVSGSALHEGRAQTMMAGIIRRLSRVLPEGTETIDVGTLQTKLGELLELLFTDLSVHDKTHSAELVVDRVLRQRRKEAADELYEKLFELRLVWNGAFGVGSSVQIFGVDDEIPRDPMALHQTAEQAYDWLTAPGFEKPRPRLLGADPDPVQLAESFKQPMDALGTTLAALSRDATASVDAQIAKNRKLGEFDRLLLEGARVLEALYDFAEMREESDRLRPSRHQRAAVEDGEPPDEEPQPLPEEPQGDDEASADEVLGPAEDTEPD